MMKVFLDTNILMDWYQAERPGNVLAKTILSAAGKDTYDILLSTQSIVDGSYSLKKLGVSYQEFSGSLRHLRVVAHVIGIDELDMLWALEHDSGDFEDDMQYACAYNNNCDYFITRDKELFKLNDPLCPMTVISPEKFVAAMREG